MAETLTISQLARLAAVNVETIRFYERQGLISKPPRGSSGFRHFPYEAVDSIRFIRVAKNLGFSLPEIQDLIRLRVSKDVQTKEDVRELDNIVHSINEKISALTVLRDDLVSLRR